MLHTNRHGAVKHLHTDLTPFNSSNTCTTTNQCLRQVLSARLERVGSDRHWARLLVCLQKFQQLHGMVLVQVLRAQCTNSAAYLGGGEELYESIEQEHGIAKIERQVILQ